MNEEMMLTMILLIGLAMGLFANFLIGNATQAVQKIKSIMENNKKFKAKQDEVAKMRAEGGMHEWVTVPTAQGELMVCKKTGWCPTLQGFIPLSHINTYLETIKTEEEYKMFRNARVQQLAHELSVTVPNMEKIVEQVFAIKKDFYLEKLDKFKKELEDKATAVEDGTKEN